MNINKAAAIEVSDNLLVEIVHSRFILIMMIF